MQILLTGTTGYVGGVIRAHLAELGHKVLGVGHTRHGMPGDLSCDLRDAAQVAALARQVNPDVVVHAAGVKDIALCAANPTLAMAANSDSTYHLAATFAGRSRIVYISADYVFDGTAGGYTEASPTKPTTQYGLSKLSGELRGREAAGDSFMVLRTAAIFGPGAAFPEFLFARLSRGQAVDCFTDAVYSPTYHLELARAVAAICEQPGGSETVHHVAGEATSRYAFAVGFARAFGFDPALVQPAMVNENYRFLLPDLSLNSDATRRALGLPGISLEEVLHRLAAEWRRPR